MTKVTIYHNPSCSKSRQALALLADRGLQVEVVEYMQNPPTPAALRQIVDLLGVSPVELVRTKERQALGLPHVTGDLDQLHQISEHPAIMQRPIVVRGEEARICRPPETVLELL